MLAARSRYAGMRWNVSTSITNATQPATIDDLAPRTAPVAELLQHQSIDTDVHVNTTVQTYPESHEPKPNRVPRPWAALRNWLFPKQHEQKSRLFPDLEADAEADTLDLANQARISGAAEMPGAGAARAATFEPSIDSHVRQLFGQCCKQVEASFAGIDAKIRSIDLKRREAELETIRERLDADCGEVFANHHHELSSLERDATEVTAEFERFRTLHALADRAPVYPDSRLLGISVLIALVLAESAMNSVFFAEGSQLGLLGGFVEAFVISLVNITFAWMIASWPMRWCQHVSLGRRWIGRLVCLIYFGLLAVFLLLITLYRDAFATDPDNAMQAAFDNFLSGSWVLNDMSSVLFCALSLLFALIALIDAFRLDDPYPGYGTIHRRQQDAIRLLDEERESANTMLVARRDDREAQLDTLSQELQARTDLLHALRNDHARIAKSSRSYTKDLEHLHLALVGRYRDTNGHARSTPCPAWFDEPVPSLDLPSLIDELPTLPDMQAISADMENLQKRTASLGIELTRRYAEAIDSIGTHAARSPGDRQARDTDVRTSSVEIADQEIL